MLIAVCTDLTMGEGEFPVIKIIEKKLTSICGQLPQVGSLVPTVALYQSGGMKEDQNHWADFDPRPIDCATSDLREIKRVMDSFDPDDINELKRGLNKFHSRFVQDYIQSIKPFENIAWEHTIQGRRRFHTEWR